MCKGRTLYQGLPFKTAHCRKCGKTWASGTGLSFGRETGKTNGKSSLKGTTYKLSEQADEDKEGDLEYIGAVDSRCKRVWIRVFINGTSLKMELDTDAGVSLVTKKYGVNSSVVSI